MRKIILAAAALAGIAAFAVPAAASAGTTPGAVFAVTHSPQHNDTTSGGPGAACGSSSNGPTWALDNLEEKFTVTPYATGEYKVIINVVGSFAGFADPGLNGTTDPAQGYCQPLSSNGSVKGTITYYVFSTQGPDSSALLPIQAPDTGLGAALGQLFPGGVTYDWAPTDAGNYLFSYQNGNYVQNTTSIIGDVRGH